MKLWLLYVMLIAGGCWYVETNTYVVGGPEQRAADDLITSNDQLFLSYLFKDEYGGTTFRTYPFTTINVGGFYRLADNILNQVTIAVSNVTLDMNGCTVSGGTNGIVINNGLTNVTIKNGMVSSVSADGIQVNSGCSDITLDMVTVQSAQRGFFLQNVTNGIIRNCDLISSNTGLELNSCKNISIEGCTAQTNKYAGFSLVTSTTCSFLDCQSLSTGQSNSDQNANIYGFVNSGGYGTIFERCIANSTQGLTVTGASVVVAGFALLGTGTQSHKIIECEAGNSMTSSLGATKPYGIYLDEILPSISFSIGGPAAQSSAVVGAAWSPDGAYFAVTDYMNGSGRLDIYSFDRVNSSVIKVASSATLGNNCISVDWSPGNDIIAIGLDPASPNLFNYSFNRLNNSLQLLESITGANSSQVWSIQWSPDGRYLAISQPQFIRIYRYDAVAQTLTVTDTYDYGGGTNVYGVTWFPNGAYLAMGGDKAGAQIQVFSFNQSFGTIGSPIISNSLTAAIAQLTWSPDGNYIAAMINTTPNTRIYRFDGSSLIQTDAQDTNGAAGGFSDIDWSPDMGYLVTANDGGVTAAIVAYSFDKGIGQLTKINSLNLTGFSASNAFASQWSPDGAFILAGTDDRSNAALPSFFLLSAIQFSAGNMIINNKVYGNSGGQLINGAGISGSSIANCIIGNDSYNNPFNYIFVCNVFNQLFGYAPTGLQNRVGKVSVAMQTPMDLPTQLQRVQYLAQFLVDNLI